MVRDLADGEEDCRGAVISSVEPGVHLCGQFCACSLLWCLSQLSTEPITLFPSRTLWSTMTREEELDLLRSRAEAIKEELEQIESEIKDLESE